MHKRIYQIITFLVLLGAFGSSWRIPESEMDFLTEQKKHERVREALQEKQEIISNRVKTIGLTLSDFNVLIVAYKDEDRLEIFAKKRSTDVYRFLVAYDVCARSGQLGPKRRQGDNQVPEGFYHIDRFNPKSNFHLSLGLNYPNASDRIKATSEDAGGDIFIHGACVTIGCLPMTDDKIKEIYAYAVHARNNGQKDIPVYIFPFRMTEERMRHYLDSYKDRPAITDFWQNIKTGFDKFDKDKTELVINAKKNGDYVF